MPTAPQDVLSLLDALSQKTNQSMDYGGFGLMAMAMESFVETHKFPPVSHRYLYENLYRACHTAKETGKSSLRISLARLDAIARFLGHQSFQGFVQSLNPPDPEPIHPDAQAYSAYLGLWYSVVRSHSEHGKKEIFISPVLIEMKEENLWMTLRGPSRNFSGAAFLDNRCLCATLTSASGKHIHLIFQVGTILEPKILTGVFVGVASAGNPVAGREILVRVASGKQMEDLGNYAIPLDNLEGLPLEVHPIIGKYFDSFEENIIKIPFPSTYTIKDLER